MADPMMPGSDMAAPPDADAPAAAGPTVLATIMQNADGSFQLTKGDEAEPGEGAEGASPGQSFDSPGQLLKAVLDIIQGAQNAGEGSAEDNFQKGFSGDKAPMAKSPAGPAGLAGRY